LTTEGKMFAEVELKLNSLNKTKEKKYKMFLFLLRKLNSKKSIQKPKVLNGLSGLKIDCI
jgi:hypothetical protein